MRCSSWLRWIALTALVLRVWSVEAAVSAKPSLFASPPEQTRLENGLTVVTIPWPSPGIVAYYTLVRVGSRDEVEPGHSGFAHLFEHMMFRGSEQLPQKEYEARIASLGADNNAYTTQDFTLYTLTGPAEALEEMLVIEADRFQHLSYDEAAFRTETGAVLGEYNKSAASPFLKLWESLSDLAFQRHTYRHTTIGLLADIQAMPDKYAYSKAFFRRFYTPDNTTLMVAGEVSHEAVVALVREHYGDWQGERDQPEIPPEPEPELGAHRHIAWNGVASPQMLWGYRVPAFARDDDPAAGLRETAALEVVHGLLFDPASALFQELVVKEQKLLDLDSWSGNFSRDPGLFVLHAELAEGSRFVEIEQRVQQAIDAAAQGQYAEQVDAVRSHLAYRLPMQVETASDAADTLAQFIAMTGRVDALSEYLQALSGVTADDVARVAGTYLVPDRRFTVTLAPQPAVEAPKGAQPAVEAPKGAQPAVEAPKGAQPTAEAPKGGQPAAPKEGKPAAKAPKGGQPAAEAPKGGQPAAPKEGKPTAEAPKGGQPAAEAPKGAQPAAEAPKGGQPAAPKEGQPAAKAPKGGKPERGKPAAAKPEAPQGELAR